MSDYITSRVKELSIIQAMRSRGADGRKRAKRFAREVRDKVLSGASGVFLWVRGFDFPWSKTSQ